MPVALAAMLVSLGALQANEAHLVESPHFTIIAEAGDTGTDAASLASTLETIRLVFFDALPRAFNNRRIDLPTPVFVHAISSDSARAELLPASTATQETLGRRALYRSGADKHYLLLPLAPAHRVASSAFHEYAHLFARVHWGELPLWLDEGFAVFWETAAIRADTVIVGVPHDEYLETLAGETAVPMRALMSVDRESEHYTRDSQASEFYAQSWALVHYMLLGDTSGERRRQLFDYIARLSSGAPEDEALKAFGDFDELELDAASYLRQPEFRMVRRPRPLQAHEGELAVRELDPAERLAYIGDFIVHGEAPLLAEPALVRAIELDSRLPLAHEGLGFLALEKERTPDALAAFSRAAELGSTSYLAHYYEAVARVRSGADPNEILDSLRRTLALNPDFAPAHRFVAAAVATRGERFGPGIASARRAIELEPSSPEGYLALGRLEMLAGEEQDGVESLRRALSLPHEGARLPAEIARLLWKANRFSDAAAAFERAIELEPKSGALHYELGKALEASGRLEDAVAHFRIARELGYAP